jgi:hypothetical protein
MNHILNIASISQLHNSSFLAIMSSTKDDPEWIIIKLVIYLGTFLVEKLEKLVCGDYSSGKSWFGDLGCRIFQSQLEASNNTFRNQNL